MTIAKKARSGARSAPGRAPVHAATAAPSSLIDERIDALADWRGEVLAQLRSAIRSADPAIVEEWKWDTPVWSCDGIICTGESYKKAVKLTFAHGASLPDPSGLFNASLDGKVRRAIDFVEGAAVDDGALQRLVRAAIAFNRTARRTSKR